MGYRIEYDARIGKYEVEKDNSWRFLFILIAVLSVFIVLTNLVWPEGRAELKTWLIPGDDVVTVTALQNLTDDLCSGAPIPEALYDFCRYVIHGA